MLVATRRSQLVLGLLVLAVLPVHATDLTGKVTSAQGGEPLGKVQVSVVGTALTAVTAQDGAFQIANAPAGKQTLRVSAVGYRSISIVFDSSETEARQINDFAISLLPDNFQRTEKVEVNADVFQSPEWPAVGDMTLTSSELQQTSTVITNDPFRSIQAMPGVSAASNNDLRAQFSVMGAPFEQVGIYVDDVYVPNLLHTVPGINDAPSLSLLTGGDVADLRVMPVAYPVRYADSAGAAIVIRTREGDPSPPLIHASIGMATSEFLGQGVFGPQKRATWLLGARKSYIGYLERYFAGTRFSEDGFYDANLKFTFALTPKQTLSLYGTGGQLGINDPHPDPLKIDGLGLVSGTSNLGLGRLGWKWTASPKLLVDARGAFVRTGYGEDNLYNRYHGLTREWSVGANVSWNWTHGAILQTGYSLRRPHFNYGQESFYQQPPIFYSFHYSDVRQDFYAQNSLQFWRDRIRLQGGLRWSKLNTEREQPITGQFSVSLKAAGSTTLEAGWGRYAQLPARGGRFLGYIPSTMGYVGLGNLPFLSSQYLVAVEQRFGERTRLRVEVFDRQNRTRDDVYTVQGPPGQLVLTLFERAAVLDQDYSRGVQVTLQRRSENKLSGWIGYTYTQAHSRPYHIALPAPSPGYGLDSPYSPTVTDQPHTVNIFGSYRLTPSIRLSAKALYGSGFPVSDLDFNPYVVIQPVSRIGPYERLDLRADKSWNFKRWKLSLYAELLNATAHDNRTFGKYYYPYPGQPQYVSTNPGFPTIPTVGLGFDF